MVDEKFRKFLEAQTRRSPLRISEDKVSWEDRDRRLLSPPSDFLESVYLGKELQNTVVMERSVAAMLQHRLTELEKENDSLRKSAKILKIVVAVVAAAAAIVILWGL